MISNSTATPLGGSRIVLGPSTRQTSGDLRRTSCLPNFVHRCTLLSPRSGLSVGELRLVRQDRLARPRLVTVRLDRRRRYLLDLGVLRILAKESQRAGSSGPSASVEEDVQVPLEFSGSALTSFQEHK